MVYFRNLFKLPQLTACFGVLWVLVFQSVVVDPLDIGDTHVAPDRGRITWLCLIKTQFVSFFVEYGHWAGLLQLCRPFAPFPARLESDCTNRLNDFILGVDRSIRDFDHQFVWLTLICFFVRSNHVECQWS